MGRAPGPLSPPTMTQWIPARLIVPKSSRSGGESSWTAETERNPRKSVKYFFVDVLAAAQTFTIIAVIDTFHSFADRLEPRQIAFLQGGNEQFPVLADDAEIAFIFGIPQHSALHRSVSMANWMCELPYAFTHDVNFKS